MNDRLQKRLAELKQEYASGEKVLADLQARQREVEQTLLRISGAIQVLEELLTGSEQAAGEEKGS